MVAVKYPQKVQTPTESAMLVVSASSASSVHPTGGGTLSSATEIQHLPVQTVQQPPDAFRAHFGIIFLNTRTHIQSFVQPSAILHH